MHIDWQRFTPWTALAGGLPIGLAAAGLLVGLGTRYGAGLRDGRRDPGRGGRFSLRART
jgi:hypothetical protein